MEQAEHEQAIEKRVRLRDDFDYYSPICLRIRPKDPTKGLIPFVPNRVQRYLHERADAELKEKGLVRILVLKGRQEGCSTYIGGRFYWKVTHRHGVRAFILTHEMDATENLFGMTERFHEHCPAAVKPETKYDNAKELSFARLDSSFGVGTAGNEAVGRSQTIQFLHGSEAAFWKNAEAHMAGLMQTVPDAPGTEIFIESTANGVGNWFHTECMKAIKGESIFTFVFIPWFWMDEYRAPIEPGFRLSPEENELIDLYGLDGAQLQWRRNKIKTLGELKFKQEYPNTPEEAFEESGDDVLISPKLIRAAFTREVEQVPAPVVWGVDPSRFGNDKKTLAKRRGNVLLEKVKVLLPGMPAGPQSDTQATAGAVVREYHHTPEALRPRYICVDTIGVGAGVADALRRSKLPNCDIIDVNVSESASSDERFEHLRDELWWMAREWFQDRGCRAEQDDVLVTEMGAVKFNYTPAGRIKVESKKEMKKRLGFSPDHADAFIITFAAPAYDAHDTVRPGTPRGRGDRRAGY